MNSRKKQKVASHQLSLRPAEEGDCELLWQWRNEENTRERSFDTNYVAYEEHRNWFLSKLNSANSEILIVSDESKKEVGQVRFDINSEGSAEVSISMATMERNKGYGSTALKLACQRAAQEFSLRKVLAHIKEGNKASINVFTKAGFINKGPRSFEGHKAIEMVWSQE